MVRTQLCPWVLMPTGPTQMLQQAVLDATAGTGMVVQEAISSIETVRAFAGEEEEERRYGQALTKMLGLRDQRDMEKAIFLLIRRVRLTWGDSGAYWHKDIPTHPCPCRHCSWPCRHWCCTVATSSSVRGPSLLVASSPSSSTRIMPAAVCR